MTDPMKPAEAAGERFFFVHVQKTAGTSFIRRMRRHFGWSSVYPDHGDGDIVACVISVDHLLERWAARRDEIRVVTGHFPLCTTGLLGDGFTTLTLLRDPVERTLSYLRHHREITPADQNLSLEAVYEDSFRFHGLVHNHMVKMFSLTVEEMTDGALTRVVFDDERLQTAKQRLATVDLIGLQERFDEFCDGAARRFGWELGNRVHSNRTERAEVSKAFRTRIAADNAMDVELYEFATTLVSQRDGAAAARQRSSGTFA